MADRIEVTLEDAKTVEFLRSKVRSGEFVSEADAVRDMVTAWREEDANYEKWLKVEIAARHEEAMTHPERLIPLEELGRRLAERRKKREALAS
jgi:Arc/MetJ-type ribon-helix-helix transcriptional regulator